MFIRHNLYPVRTRFRNTLINALLVNIKYSRCSNLYITYAVEIEWNAIIPKYLEIYIYIFFVSKDEDISKDDYF